MRYDYKCDKCGIIEIEHPMGQKVEKCPTCGFLIQRVYNVVKPVFKGSNWSKDNYGLK